LSVSQVQRSFTGIFFGVSDVSPWIGLAVVGTSFVAVSAIALALLRSGYKLRH
jgi:ABC-2 type transport system permease protein